MTDIAAPAVPIQQVIKDLRRAADLQGRYGWKPVHWLDHKTGNLGIHGALRMAVYGIASYSVDPTFVPTEEQRARIWRASQALNEYVTVNHGVRYATDWNAAICTRTDDAVVLFQSVADELERTSK
jgi:hypothetical protein